MGLHTGEPKVGEERYVGIGVHRAARIGAAGHGGQVLLSSTTKELAEEELPPGVTIRDLGERRLKDIDQPQRLYQLVVEGLQSDFAQLKTLDVELRAQAPAHVRGRGADRRRSPQRSRSRSSPSAREAAAAGMTVQGNAVAEIDPSSNTVVGQVPNVGARPGSIASARARSGWPTSTTRRSRASTRPRTRHTDVRGRRHAHRPCDLEGRRLGRRLDPVKARRWSSGRSTHSSTRSPARDPDRQRRAGRRRLGCAPRERRSGSPRPRACSPASTRDTGAVAAEGSTRTAGRRGSPSALMRSGSPTASANTVTRVDPTDLLTPIAVGHGPSGIAVGAGAVWVADTLDDSVVRIDPGTRAVTNTVPVGARPRSGSPSAAGSVWVANSRDGTVTRIDAVTAKPLETIHVGGSPQAVAIANGRVWVTVAERCARTPGRPASRAGRCALTAAGRRRLDGPGAGLFPDRGSSCTPPARSCSTTRTSRAGRLTARSRGRSVAARALGRRQDLHVHDPQGLPLLPALERACDGPDVQVHDRAQPQPEDEGSGSRNGYLSDVVGAKAYVAGKAPHISGIVARGNTLTVRLVAPAPDFVDSHRSAVLLRGADRHASRPEGGPARPLGGPVLRRVLHARAGSCAEAEPQLPRQPPPSTGRIELDRRRLATRRLSGRSRPERRTIATGYGRRPGRLAPGSRRGTGPGARPRRRAGSSTSSTPRRHSTSWSSTRIARSSATSRLRRAVNYAIDRRALARLGDFCVRRARNTRPTNTCRPGCPGFNDARIYPLTPDVATARRLAGQEAAQRSPLHLQRLPV